MNRLVERLREWAGSYEEGSFDTEEMLMREAVAELTAKDSTIASLTAERDEYKRRADLWQEKGDALDEAREAAEATVALRDDRIAVLEKAQAIKPLEWKFYQQAFPPCWCAYTPFGDCVVEEEAGSDSPTYAARGIRMNVVARTEGLPEAKAAAQADYETRIRAALGAGQPTLEAEAVAWDACLEDGTVVANYRNESHARDYVDYQNRNGEKRVLKPMFYACSPLTPERIEEHAPEPGEKP